MLPFNIYMQPPNVLLQPIYSGLNLFLANNIGAWATVVQVNPNTLNVVEGNVVFYNPQDVPIIYSSDTNQFYNIINEDRILFVEGGVPLPP
jgi:hypothetical protein